ncbi:ATP-binding protein [[Limnothrix rosea] IAM M-220]|uniref:ATP-binding protein n=1 Tax=[Limnothrix rosea] IAM M-220 TaxID=454133 RepID=UPI00398C9E70
MMETANTSVISSRTLYPQIASLLVYQDVFDCAIGQAFLALLQRLYTDQSVQNSNATATTQCLKCYGLFFRELAIADLSWPDWLVKRILQDDNPFSQQAQRKSLEDIAMPLQQAVKHDLRILQQIYHCEPNTFSHWVQVATQVAAPVIPWDGDRQSDDFLHHSTSWASSLDQLAGYYHRHGVGQFAQYEAFRWLDGTLHNILEPDWLPLDDIVGYDTPKAALVQNTECLLAGLPALNVLLYGSRGSGKSSLVKALLGQYKDQGLRLVEVDKQGFRALPEIVEILRQQPQKFIIFVDDLSFEEDDDIFKSLKVVLEGSIRAKASNVVVYATSNRRHLVREFFEERPRPSEAHEIHNWDTVQEKLSFSDRFGLTLTFEPANQNTYLDIVHHLAQRANLQLDTDTLEFRAKQWATRHNGRSGRTARQFVDFLIGEQALTTS